MEEVHFCIIHELPVFVGDPIKYDVGNSTIITRFAGAVYDPYENTWLPAVILENADYQVNNVYSFKSHIDAMTKSKELNK